MAKKRNNSLMAAITLPAILLSSVPATADAAKVASEGQHAAKVVRSVLQYSLYKRGKSEVFRRGITYTPMSGSNKMLAYLSKDGVQTTLYLCELDLDIEDNKSTLATRCYRDKGADGSVDAVVDS
ncbi:hypothetical protein KY363_08300, partial [Candidatus Woesearchaeota archaeon]|nr:hypothetical protein [Candidatus Woesearchaeota archaeon]